MIDIEWWVYLAVLGGLVLVSLLLHVLVVAVATEGTPAKQHGIAALFIGVDNRTSTSKLQALLWTYAILWALISVLAGGGAEEFNDVVGDELRDEYFLLLGGPYLVAIAAKAKTTHDVSRARERKQRDPKPAKPPDAHGGPAGRVAEIVTKDDGSVDLGDFQYFAFTLLTLTYFVWAFIASPSDGLPGIPGTLLVLTGVSQAAYLGKKVLVGRSPDEEQDVQETVSKQRQGRANG
jgi:hypothetical protein